MTDLPFFGHVIDGVESSPDAGEHFDSVNPWTRRPWAQSRWEVGRRPTRPSLRRGGFR